MSLQPTIPTLLSISNAQAIEGQNLVFDFKLSCAALSDTIVHLSATDVTATGGVDYSNTFAEVSFDGGITWTSTTADVSVPVGKSDFKLRLGTMVDSISEPNETFNLIGTTNGSTATGVGTISDSKVVLSTASIFSVSNATVTEGQNLVFDVVLANVNSAPTSVKFGLTDISTTLGADYGGGEISFDNGASWTALTSDTVQVAGGISSFKVRANTMDDAIVEQTETFTLSVSANGSTKSGTGTINDNDKLAPTATIGSITDATVTEGQKAVFDVTLANVNAADSVVTLYPDSISAGYEVDYSQLEVSFDGTTWTPTKADFTVTVPGGVNKFQVRTHTIDDTLVEGTEVFKLVASANGVSKSGTSTILDNDKLAPTATIGSISNVTVTEGQKAIFDVTLANVNAADSVVKLNLNDISTSGASDYSGLEVSFDGTTWTSVTSDLTVPGGVSKFQVRTHTVDNTSFEQPEQFTLTASANGSSKVGTGTILDNDKLLPTATVASISDATVTEGQKAIFDVTLANVNAADSVVTLYPDSISAGYEVDYSQLEVSFDGTTWTPTKADFTVTVPGGVNKFQVRTHTIDDTLVEGTEVFKLVATANGVSKSGLGTINDNDVAKVKLVGDVSIHEGSTGAYHVEIDSVSDQDRYIKLDIHDGTANRYDGNISGQDVNGSSDGGYSVGTSAYNILYRVFGRVPNGTTLAEGDRPQVGPSAQNWDFNVTKNGQLNSGNTITVKIAAGQTKSEAININTAQEKVVIDSFLTPHGLNANAVENAENFTIKIADAGGLSVENGSLNVTIVDKTAYRYISPIAIDLNGDGVQTISVDQGVQFDLLNTGSKVTTGWLSAEDGFLAIDANGNGQIDDRSELFGGGVGDGFAKLATFDSNQDGVVNASDSMFGSLLIWQDGNSNGITDNGELNTLSVSGIASLNTSYTNQFTSDDKGNILGEVSSAVTKKGDSLAMVDVYFQYN